MQLFNCYSNKTSIQIWFTADFCKIGKYNRKTHKNNFEEEKNKKKYYNDLRHTHNTHKQLECFVSLVVLLWALFMPMDNDKNCIPKHTQLHTICFTMHLYYHRFSYKCYRLLCMAMSKQVFFFIWLLLMFFTHMCLCKRDILARCSISNDFFISKRFLREKKNQKQN